MRTLCLALGLALGANAWAADPATAAPAPAASRAPAATPSAPAPAKAASKEGRDTASKTTPVESLPTNSGSAMAEKIRAALSGTAIVSKKMTVTVEDNPKPPPRTATPTPPAARTLATQRYQQARAAAVAGHAAAPAAGDKAHGGEAHWAYEGDTGPQAWGKLKPDFNTCAIGKRQSPINIENGNTLQGPAEPVQFAYTPSNGTVVNNGHTIQVDVQGENTITVRGSTYRLLQFHFHTPSEEQINSKRFPMVAHLVHKNNEGQLAVVAVLLDEGAASPFIDKVWTYMPLDANDRVRMPQGLLNLAELLPTDQRYYQFMGSLTTPPCSEGVLWMVMKQPVTISRGQYRLFTQLYPNNARPVQAVNGRVVREAL
ncbi:carbonic anhydrase family protein [Rhodoferax sp. AJA081-3]|nr:carbonic anhydrase family protein [Rhodoferax sp. AJA081-3]